MSRWGPLMLRAMQWLGVRNLRRRERGKDFGRRLSFRGSWSTTGPCGKLGLLEAHSVEEMMALPGQRDKVVWASGDATLDRVAGIDWNAKKAFSCQVEPLKSALNQFIAEATHEAATHNWEEGSGFIISITELLAVVTLASLRAVEWKGHAVLYAGDNQNVIRWLAKRQARHPVATYLLQILAALEASTSFRIFGAFLRTYHNVTADALTREDAETVMGQKGLEELPGAKEALTTQLNRGWQKRALIDKMMPTLGKR